MRRAAVFALLAAVLVAGCGSPGGAPAEPTPSTSSPSPSPVPSPSATPSPTVAPDPGPEPDWDFTLPGLPPAAPSAANTWERGADLGPEWRVEANASAGRYQLLWLVTDTDREPSPGYACGASIGTQTDFDVVNHAVRTGLPRERFPAGGSLALLSDSHRDASTSCGGKQHWFLHANGTAWSWLLGWDEAPRVAVAANGSALLVEAGLWLGPGQAAAMRIDRTAQEPWGNQTRTVHHTGLARLVHLGSWDPQRTWFLERSACGPDDADRSRNCVDRGHGP